MIFIIISKNKKKIIYNSNDIIIYFNKELNRYKKYKKLFI